MKNYYVNNELTATYSANLNVLFLKDLEMEWDNDFVKWIETLELTTIPLVLPIRNKREV